MSLTPGGPHTNWTSPLAFAGAMLLTAIALCTTVIACQSPRAASTLPPEATGEPMATKDAGCHDCSELHSAQRTTIALRGTPVATSEDAIVATSIPVGDPLPEAPEDRFWWAYRNHRPAVVLFTAAQCESCAEMRALLESARREFESVLFLLVDVETTPGAGLTAALGARSVPSWYLLDDAGTGILLPEGVDEGRLRNELDGLTR